MTASASPKSVSNLDPPLPHHCPPGSSTTALVLLYTGRKSLNLVAVKCGCFRCWISLPVGLVQRRCNWWRDGCPSPPPPPGGCSRSSDRAQVGEVNQTWGSETSAQCRHNDGPASATPARHCADIGPDPLNRSGPTLNQHWVNVSGLLGLQSEMAVTPFQHWGDDLRPYASVAFLCERVESRCGVCDPGAGPDTGQRRARRPSIPLTPTQFNVPTRWNTCVSF